MENEIMNAVNETTTESGSKNDFIFGVLVGFGLYGAARGVYKLVKHIGKKKAEEAENKIEG